MSRELLAYEIERNKGLLEQYKRLGPEGALGVSTIERDIEFGRKALKEKDEQSIQRAYNILKDNT